MPQLTILDEQGGRKQVEVPSGRRLVLAIEEAGVRIGHRCGGFARCTTCRVEFQEGEPRTITAAERAKLEERGLAGQVRLSCQIVVDHDMSVRPVMTVENQGWDAAGPDPQPTVTPDPATEPLDQQAGPAASGQSR